MSSLSTLLFRLYPIFCWISAVEGMVYEIDPGGTTLLLVNKQELANAHIGKIAVCTRIIE